MGGFIPGITLSWTNPKLISVALAKLDLPIIEFLALNWIMHFINIIMISSSAKSPLPLL